MKKSLAHLPKHKCDELKLVVKIIRKQFPSAHMLVLFGSYARNEWVEETYTEGHITYEYISDFDILVLTRLKKTAADSSKQSTVDNHIIQHKAIKTPVSVIYHSVGQVNYHLKEGRYFFADIKKEGILLYDSGKLKLERIRKPSPAKRKQIAEEDFKLWFNSAREFYVQYEYAFKRRKYKVAAFLLHQAVERFYSTVLLVFTGYKGKRHNIEKYGRQASGCDTAFLKVFPRATKEQDENFKLLKKAYIDARYKKDYKITRKQLEYLAKRVKVLQRLTKKICTEKIESFV
jgi:HEPN domain-containing protein/predicted nucleotidyltransferase